MIAVDTNILARFYVDDPTDPEAALQRPVASRVMESHQGVFVPVTVILEFAWVLKAFYHFGVEDIVRVMEHLLSLPNTHVEDSESVRKSIALFGQGLDIADSLHVVRSSHCERFVTFDDKRFARRASRLGVSPLVEVPA